MSSMNQPEVQRERKRRKWDVPAPEAAAVVPKPLAVGVGTGPAGLSVALASRPPCVRPGQPPDPDAIKRAQAAALAVVSKLNKESVAKGLIPATKLAGQFDEKKEISREVSINDAPTQVRYNLTRRFTQEDIQRRTGTVIVTRGKFCGPGSTPDDREKPLHLRISPGAGAGNDDASKERAVEAGMAEVLRILRADQNMKDTSTSSGYYNAPPPLAQTAGVPSVLQGANNSTQSKSEPQPPVTQLCQAKVFVEIDAPIEFNLVAKLQGPDNSYLKLIVSQTGATVVLRGQGSGAGEGQEQLHFLLTCANREKLEDAKSFINNIIAAVKTDFYRTYPPVASAQNPPAPQAFRPQNPHPPHPLTGPVPYPHPPYPPQVPPTYGQPLQQPPYYSRPSQPYYQPPGAPLPVVAAPPTPSPANHPAQPPPYAHMYGHHSSYPTAYGQTAQHAAPGYHYNYSQQPAADPPSTAVNSVSKSEHSRTESEKPGKRRFREFFEEGGSSREVPGGPAGTLPDVASTTSVQAVPPIPSTLPPPLPPSTPVASQVNSAQTLEQAAASPHPGHQGTIGSANKSAGDSGTLVGLVDYEGED